MSLKMSLDSKSIRDSLGHVTKTVKRDDGQVSLVVSRNGDNIWLESHGPVRHMQVSLLFKQLDTDGELRGLTMESKMLSQLARGNTGVDLIVDESSVKFRRKGPFGDLTGQVSTLGFDGKVTNPQGKVADEVRVDLTEEQASAIGEALARIGLRNAIAKEKPMEVWIRMSSKGTRLMVFDDWHSAIATMPSITSHENVSLHVDRDLLTAVASMPGGAWSMRAGSDSVRVHNDEFALKSSVVDTYDGPTDSDMAKKVAETRKAVDGTTPALSMDLGGFKDMVRDLGISNASTEPIVLDMVKDKIVWSCRATGGRVSVNQPVAAVNAKGNWGKEKFQVSPALLNDIMSVMPSEGNVGINFVNNICTLRTKADGFDLTYMILLSEAG